MNRDETKPKNVDPQHSECDSTRSFIDGDEPTDATLEVGGEGQDGVGEGQDAGETVKLGRYEVIERVGQGGMGVVLRVRDPSLGRDLAIKTLHARGAQDAVRRSRFVEEAQIAGQLQHPGVAPVHEVGVLPDGTPYFTMKLVEGDTLAKLLKARDSAQESLPRLLDVFEQICQTIAYAHSRGVIHRDLKPANIMVGSFGEVQVMDWGLAKVLGAGQDSDTSPQSPGRHEDERAVRTIRHDDSETDAVLLATQAGSIFGTPAYMPPEQARGEVDVVDQRADVFALGAILCEILTGRPPYDGARGNELLQRARSGDLAAAESRVRDSGADAALTDLCLACLQRDPANRLFDAADVANRVRDYGEGVESRLQQARTERAAAEAQAEEQKKRVAVERSRRRVATALAAAIMLLLIGGAGVALWVQRLQAERAAETLQQRIRQDQIETKASEAIAETQAVLNPIEQRLSSLNGTRELMDDFDAWQIALTSAEASWKTATGLVADSDLPSASTIRSQLNDLQRDLELQRDHLQLARALEQVRLDTVALVNNRWDPYHAAARYENLLSKFGILDGELEEVSNRIRQQPTRFVIVGAIDHWAEVLTYPNDLEDEKRDRDVQRRLFEIARRVDPDPWRDEFRSLATWDHQDSLLRLLQDSAGEEQTAQTLISACRRLDFHGGDPGPIIRSALARNPGEFWLHFFAGNWSRSRDIKASIGHFRAALAVRPDSPAVLNELGSTLSRLGDHDEAETCFEEALRINPQFYFAHFNWGESLARRSRYDEAYERLRRTLEVNAEHVPTLTTMAACRMSQGRYDEADLHVEQALAIDPDDVDTRCIQASVLMKRHRYFDADALLRQIIADDPYSQRAHQLWGNALATVGNLPAAASSLRTALGLDERNTEVMVDLASILSRSGQTIEAETLFQRATQLDPRTARYYSDWGVAKYDQGEPREAEVHFRRVLELMPDYGIGHANLGNALGAMGRHEEAIEHFQRAVEMIPQDGFVRYVYGTQLLQTERLEAAAEQFRVACQLQPDNAEAHCNLGHALQRMGRFAEAIEPLKQGHAIAERNPSWTYPSAWWIEKVERMVVLNSHGEDRTSVTLDGDSIEGEVGQDDPPDVFYSTRDGRRKAYDIELKAGRSYQFQLESEFEAFLKIEDKVFQTLRFATRPDPNTTTVTLQFTPPKDGRYHLVVSSVAANQNGSFQLSARELATLQ